jgi:N-acyl-D-amino-acid deacylase
MDYDLTITGGTIIDGTGSPPVRGDIAVKEGRVAEIGKVSGRGKQHIDAGGLMVAPGFVDIHTHYDAQVMWDRALTISPWHGVTSVVMGNCGFGIAPTRPEHRGLIMRTLEKVEGMSLSALEGGLGYDWPFESFPQYLDTVERNGTAINVAALVGHTTIRMYVMGEESTERPATPAQVERMRTLVREALDAGAVGFATSRAATHLGYGGKPVPSRLADLDELRALTRVLGEARRGILQVTPGRDLAVEDFAEIAREIKRPITWTALLAGLRGPGSHRPVLEKVHGLTREGLTIRPQVTPRPLYFEFQFREPFVFESMKMFKPVAAADLEGKMRIYADPEFRAELRGKIGADGPPQYASMRLDRVEILECPSDRTLQERRVGEVARERGVHPVDLALDLALASRLQARFRMAVYNLDEAEVTELLSDPDTVLGVSDAGAHASLLCDACYPTYLLGHWVRELGALKIEEAIRMMTSRTAGLFGLTDRGRLAAGMPADIVLFNPETVAAGNLRRVWDLPSGADRLVADAVGIEAVIVNGTIIRRDNHDTVDLQGPLPGRVLRSGPAAI